MEVLNLSLPQNILSICAYTSFMTETESPLNACIYHSSIGLISFQISAMMVDLAKELKYGPYHDGSCMCVLRSARAR